MPILAAGSRAPVCRSARASLRGFTLLELLVVISIVLIASAGVALSLRDGADTQTEREAQRLVALLESARAQSRARGVAVVWRSTPQGFQFDGLAPNSLPSRWLAAGTQVSGDSRLELGPEPIIGAQSVVLLSADRPGPGWRVATDGLRPFSAQPAPELPLAQAGRNVP